LPVALQVDTKPGKPGNDAHLRVVGRIGWAAAVSGVATLAEQCTRRAATSQVRLTTQAPYSLEQQDTVALDTHQLIKLYIQLMFE
jgi:hypothetical protein